MDKFMKLCQIADIPITRTEKAIMKEAGYNTKRFLAICKERHVYLTDHELILLGSTPLEGDDEKLYVDDITVGELKMEMGELRAREIRKGNVRCGDMYSRRATR